MKIEIMKYFTDTIKRVFGPFYFFEFPTCTAPTCTANDPFNLFKTKY